MAWVACIADARPVEEYGRLLTGAGFQLDRMEGHDDALREMVHQIRLKLLGVEIAVGLEKLKLPGVDLTAAKQLAASALQAVAQRRVGYTIVTAIKRDS